MLTSTRGFSGKGYQMMSIQFYNDRPWLPLQRKLRQNRQNRLRSTPNPWTDRQQIWNTWLRRGYLLPKKIWAQSAQGICPPPYTRNIHPKPSNFYFTFFSSSEPLQRRPLDRFSRLKRLILHTTCFCARKCLLGVRKIYFKIWPIYLKHSKNL